MFVLTDATMEYKFETRNRYRIVTEDSNMIKMCLKLVPSVDRRTEENANIRREHMEMNLAF